MHTLRAERATKVYAQESVTNEVLKDISYTFLSDSSYAITGVSGTGKSTLIHILASIDKPTSGLVFYDDINLNTMFAKEHNAFLNKAVGLVFQDPHLIKELTVVENVMLKGLVVGQSYDEAKKEALSLLNMIGLDRKANDHPLSLSGGQQQRVAVLRALFNKPVFLLADEPTGSLDAESAKLIIDLLVEAKKNGTGLIICSHDPYVAEAAETQLVLKHGTLVELS